MGLFDFNGDGKTSMGEKWIAYNIFKECTKDDESDYDDYLCDDSDLYDEEEDYSWRDECEDGFDYGVDAEDFETLEEYEEALNEAKYAWREECDDGSEYGLDVDDYETAEEYEEALNEAKYAWREECEDGFDYGVDAEDYETLEEYEEALEEAKNDLESEQDDEEEDDFDIAIPIELEVSVNCPNKGRTSAFSVAREEARQVALNDKNIYHYCGVVYENSSYPYHYRTNDTSLKIGDKVIVPVGTQNKEVVAEVVSVEQHTRLTVPYPVEKCKFILRKCDE